MTKKNESIKMTVRERVENWLKINDKLINKRAWDLEIGAPFGTIQKFTKYDKKLNSERIKKMNKRIKELYRINGKPFDSA